MTANFPLLAAVTLVLSAEAGASSPTEAERWQAMALADLEAARARIVEAHPGVIDSERPDFNIWVYDGFEQAKAHVKYVVSYDTALAAVRVYTSGFEDSHLTYSDDIRKDFPVWVSGWHIKRIGEQYVVSTALPDWSSTLPPVGSTWTGCDGATPEEVLQTRIGPFVNRRSDDRSRDLRAGMLWMRFPVPKNLRKCSFITPDGDKLDLAVSYQPVTPTQFFDARNRAMARGVAPQNGYEVKDGLLWVQAGNFIMREESTDLAGLGEMLAGLAAVRNVHTIVFDVRGNRGGDSSIGDRIFAAATGGLEFDQEGLDSLPAYYAQWRVSDYLLDYLTSNIEESERLYGAGSQRVAEDIGFRDLVLAAKEEGQEWVGQHAGRRITRADVVARDGRLRRFHGRVALLTDGVCISACLDFADTVLQSPNSVHLGQTTAADSVYMVGSTSRLPSGNRLAIPVKVWRNRVRGNNEALRPDVLVDLAEDEPDIRRAVRGALGLH